MRTLRLTFRALLKEPAFTAATVVTLALAIGANSAMFSAVHAVLLKPHPVREPDRLVVGWRSDLPHNLAVVELSYRTFEAWAARSGSFSVMAAIGSSTWPAILVSDGPPVRLASAGVSVSFFDTLGVAPLAGRSFRAEDDIPNAPRVVILSHRAWTTRFGGDPRIVGKTLQMDQPHAVVGVMPQGFDFPRGTDFWTPVVPILAAAGAPGQPSALENVGVLFAIGRLRDGVTPQAAQIDLDRLDRDNRSGTLGTAVVVTPFVDHVIGPVRGALWALVAAVGVLLLIACANVSGLMLTRVVSRRREQAVRMALGATHGDVARYWATEGIVLSLAAGVLGLLSSRWITNVVVALAPEEVPRLADISINLPVAAFTLTAILVTAVACGLAPIRDAAATNLVEALNDGARATPARRSRRSRSLLLVFQIGLTVVLLIAAGLVVRSFRNLRTLDLGFAPANVLTMTVAPRRAQQPVNEWMRELLERVAALPRVEAAGAVYLRPLALGPIGQETAVVLEGQPDTPEAARRNPALNYQVATPDYFGAMRIPLKRGRLFTDDDRVGTSRVVLVGESAARRLWPNEDPIGRRILIRVSELPGAPAPWRTVVGVVSDVRYRGLDDVRLDIYDAADQVATGATDLVVRTTGNPLTVAAAIEAEVRRLDAGAIVDRVTTMDAIVSRAIAPWRFSMWMFTAFAGLAFVLATFGLVSTVGLDVASRRHEYAVRLAVGARREDILRSVLSGAVWRVVPGALAGLLIAIAATRAIQSMLFGVERLDVATYAFVLGLVFSAVTGASYLPARRAARTDPMALLKR